MQKSTWTRGDFVSALQLVLSVAALLLPVFGLLKLAPPDALVVETGTRTLPRLSLMDVKFRNISYSKAVDEVSSVWEFDRDGIDFASDVATPRASLRRATSRLAGRVAIQVTTLDPLPARHVFSATFYKSSPFLLLANRVTATTTMLSPSGPLKQQMAVLPAAAYESLRFRQSLIAVGLTALCILIIVSVVWGLNRFK